MNSVNPIFIQKLEEIKAERSRIYRIGFIVVGFCFMAFTANLSLQNYNEEKSLTAHVHQAQAILDQQEARLKQVEDEPTYNQATIGNSTEIAGNSSYISEDKYKILSVIYQDPNTDELTKNIIKELMADDKVTVEEFSKNSQLFKEIFERINKQSIKADLSKSL